MLPYSLIPRIAVLWLTVRHVRSTLATNRSKRLVVALAIVTVLIPRVLPAPEILVVLLQILICAYIILHEMIMTDDSQKAKQ